MNRQRLRPRRVKVFGSAIVRVPPDSASIAVAITRVEKEPKGAFAKARQAAQAVHACLQQAGVKDFGASRVTLSVETRYTGGENKFVGYRARIGYSVVLGDLDRAEELLAGLIAAGANELTSVTFQKRLKEARADARRRAVAAAREKAELYCAAAGALAGKVLAIDDVSPDVLSGRQEGHVHREPAVDDVEEGKALDPGAIAVGAAVYVVYEIEPGEKG